MLWMSNWKETSSCQKDTKKKSSSSKWAPKWLVSTYRWTSKCDKARKQVHSRSYQSVLYVNCANAYSRSDSHYSCNGLIWTCFYYLCTACHLVVGPWHKLPIKGSNWIMRTFQSQQDKKKFTLAYRLQFNSSIETQTVSCTSALEATEKSRWVGYIPTTNSARPQCNKCCR